MHVESNPNQASIMHHDHILHEMTSIAKRTCAITYVQKKMPNWIMPGVADSRNGGSRPAPFGKTTPPLRYSEKTIVGSRRADGFENAFAQRYYESQRKNVRLKFTRIRDRPRKYAKQQRRHRADWSNGFLSGNFRPVSDETRCREHIGVIRDEAPMGMRACNTCGCTIRARRCR